MTITVNNEGQITLPEQLLNHPGWEPGSKLVLDANEKGELILRPERIAKNADPDRFKKAVGAAEIKWEGTTDEYMTFIRGENE
jgi:bifunctional DNA-binding transcriptional regulator/antitoxin component of YhaV-PrlF toxin-antitoxin module